MILATDAAYALIGQSHDGFLGAIQRALSRASSHIWFERSEAKDRSLVAKRLFLLFELKNVFSDCMTTLMIRTNCLSLFFLKEHVLITPPL